MIKPRVLISCVCAILLLGSCRVFKPAASYEQAANGSSHPVKPTNSINASGTSGTRRVYKITRYPSQNNDQITGEHPKLFIIGNIETSNDLQFKYAVELDVVVEALNNVHLLSYIEEWCGTKYRYGGNSKGGIDCSAFTSGLMANVYELSVPRTVREQYRKSLRIEPYELQEGDLVFFNTKGSVTHVGVYLMNNKFVHASATNGVMISDLNESYYYKRFAGAGRVR